MFIKRLLPLSLLAALALMVGFSLPDGGVQGEPPGPSEPHRGGRKTHVPKMSYLDNGTIRLGVDLNLGGAITYLSPSDKEFNVVNNYDYGRQIQMAYYSGPVPYTVKGKQPSKQWERFGWNPIQAGDDFGHGSKVVEHQNDGKTIHVKCIPMEWPLNDEPGECTCESWIELDGFTAHVRCRFENHRSDKTQYPANDQEMPAVYVIPAFQRLMTYTGARPFTEDRLTRIQARPEEEGYPWTKWLATENWAALVNDDGWGVGIWNPRCYRFTGGVSGKPGRGGSRDIATGYLAPNRQEILDHNIRYDYDYVLLFANLPDIRKYIDGHAAKPAPPTWRFESDRQGWYYVNTHDTGWPVRGGLNVVLDRDDPDMIGPLAFWQAADAPILYIRAAYRTTATEAQVFWSTHAEPQLSKEKTMVFPITGDGEWRTYQVRMADSPRYRGAIMNLRFDPIPSGGPGQSVRIKSIGFEKPEE